MGEGLLGKNLVWPKGGTPRPSRHPGRQMRGGRRRGQMSARRVRKQTSPRRANLIGGTAPGEAGRGTVVDRDEGIQQALHGGSQARVLRQARTGFTSSPPSHFHARAGPLT